MKKYVVMAAAMAAFGFVNSASAADMPVKARPIVPVVYNWTGFYIGGDVGYAWGRSTGTLTSAAGASPVPYSADPNGVIGGGFLGYNYQFNQFVVGVEADWQAANLDGSGIGTLSGTSYTMTTKINNYGALRGRLGFAINRWLVFATGGWAWGHASTTYSITGIPAAYTNSFNGNGWTAGGGVEYAVTNNWLARIEYRYTDLGSHSFVNVAANAADTGNKVTINDVRFGVAYKF